MSFGVGKLVSVSSEAMAQNARQIVLDALATYRVWPAKTKLESEIGAMNSQSLSAFVRKHKFVDVLKRDDRSLCFSPSHREGRGWKGVKSYIEEEIPIRLTAPQDIFYRTLLQAFASAT